ncbi:FtsH protease activity modulator HflK [Lysobacter solisilvae (ex Woo and Kim 2020)]|uniref:Protein HflK n=1 Tax=Agrilutibacter terrestris TaxID=2865112 RepID=A0A7H0FVJ4_9GAMM|nr:FtsH protease activity modulator HflK [Lysobacter terrestris]QNP40060.1 FtsH protease activity modulator HflK [Lysobacter terrestris]
MAWNTPGSSGNNPSGPEGRRPHRPRKTGGVLDTLLDTARGLFGGDGSSAWRWVALVLGLWLVFSSFVLVTEQERGVVLRFGRYARIMDPGPHFKAPWPIETVEKVNATQSNAYSENVPVFTRDGNMVNVEINVQYRIGDPLLYKFGTRDADETLKEAAQSAVREQVGRSDLDTVLNARGELTVAVRDHLQKALQAYQTGLVLTELNLPNARPPDDVKDAFDEVQRARAEKNTAINEAQAYAKRIVPEARGEASRTRTVAEGYKTASIARASGDATRFSLLVDQYKSAPDVTRKRLWLETLQGVLAENRTIVGGDSRQLIYVPMGDKRPPPSAASAPLLTPDVLSPAVNADASNEPGRPSRGSRPTREEDRR